MKKFVTAAIAMLLFTVFLSGQNNNYRIIEKYEGSFYPMLKIAFDTIEKGDDGSYSFSLKTPIAFSTFGIGWTEPSESHHRGDFEVLYRVKKTNSEWNKFQDEDAFVAPNETPTGMYWTNVLFGIDEYQHHYLEFKLRVPANCNIAQIQLSLMDMSKDVDPEWKPELVQTTSRTCPVFPAYIDRSGWCGGYTACHNATYTVTYINPTHAVIHHGASPNTYTDGAAVARSYWNYHVNTLGWADIGYNYLTDKYGNLYQGRKNPDLPNRDVRASHAGASNPYSIGVNFMGHADSTLPTTVQLEKCQQLLAWWFNRYGFDPTTSAVIVLQSGGSASKPRICGHKDVNVGGTTCPGTVLYGHLPAIRTGTKAIIDACSVPADTEPPTTSILIEGNPVDNWRAGDFNVTFNDYDNAGGSGVDKSYYQVLDYNGTEWRANAAHGFFNDNFNTAIHPDWTALSGTWVINSGRLEQSDQSLTNNNIYTALTQNAQHDYLYHFSGKMSGTGTNKRFGFYFFADNPTQDQRGNAYMAYFRADDNRVELYKSVGNTIGSPVVTGAVTINNDTWYDYKVTFSPASGVIKMYVNNALICTYTDPSPHQSGTHLSFRTGGCIGQYDDFKVRKTRSNRVLVTVGNNSANQVRYQSPNSSQDACRINTIVKDLAENWSEVVAQQIYIDYSKPTTTSSVAENWQTENFQVNFTDGNDLSGVERRFYQVIDFDGQDWRANAERGFFSDNFDNAIHTDWTQQTGTWSIQSGSLVQTNESLSNTNLWAYLKQDLSNRYLYNFTMKIEGAGTNRRAGFHFFCDDPTLANRGNSYFIWFRVESQYLEFYKVYNNEFNQELVVPISFQAGQLYDVKVIFDRITGEMFVYLDDKLIGEWKDTNPYSSGDYISFRSGNSKLSVNNLKVYRTRLPDVDVTLGSAAADIRYQNPNPSTFAAKVKSIVSDKAANLSDIYYHDLNVDWTAPVSNGTINDGTGYDIDSFTETDEISANWTAFDEPHSGIAAYYYAIGNSPGASNIVNWTNCGSNTTITRSGLSLVLGETYYVSVYAVNNAGLISDTITSNGQTLVSDTPVPVANFTHELSATCSGTYVTFTNSSENSSSYQWAFENGNPATSTEANPVVSFTQTGTFDIQLVATGSDLTDTMKTQITISSILLQAVADAGSNQIVGCDGSSVQIGTTEIAGMTYSWAPATGLSDADIAIPTALPATNITYTLTVESTDGCTATDAVNVSVLLHASADAGSNQTVGCDGNPVQIGTTELTNMMYAWAPAAGLSDPVEASPMATPSTTTTYTLTVESTDGCTATDLVSVNVLLQAVADAGSNQTVGCDGSLVQIGTTEVAGMTYSWAPATGLSDAGIAIPTALPATNTTYTLTVESTDGCTATDLVSVNVLLQAVADAGTNQTVGCDGSSVQIGTTEVPGMTYLWAPATGLSDAGIAIPTALPTANTTYTLTVESADGCTATDIVSVIVLKKPVADFDATDTIVDINPGLVSFNNYSEHATSYLWDFGDGNTSNLDDPTHQYLSQGTYTIMLIASNDDCENDTLVREQYITITNLVSISEADIKEGKYSVFPNPFSDKIYIQGQNLSEYNSHNIRITDMSGREIFSSETLHFYNGVAEVKIPYSLKNANYLLHIKAEDGVQVFQLQFIGKE